MPAKLLAIASSIAILFFVLELTRRQKMTFKYSVVWLGISILTFFLALEPRPLFWVSKGVGFALPSNFIFFLLTIFVILLSLLLTIYANEQNSRSETLAQSIALLQYQIKQLEAKLSEKEKPKSETV